ncbi:IS30 family transposase [Bacillus sp. JJ1127]|uniref:IS30 family transposase n=1 Tax=Bacillus sp. JJ1127 TaxID=3122952 RepID=UPI002FFFDD88
MSYSHFTMFERGQLESLYKLGYSTRKIGATLKRHHSSIARELKRNSQENSTYHSEQAHRKYIQRRKNCKPIGKWSRELAKKIQEKLEVTWSPEQIQHGYLKGKVSFKTIYNWLYQGKLFKQDLSLLRQKGKRQKPKETRGRFNVGTSIQKRPSEVRKRETFGHWELDTIVSSRGKSKGCFATFVERKTRYYQAIVIPDRTAESMEFAIKQIAAMYSTTAFQTATVDRGKEFSCYQRVENNLKIAVFFADPYSSWQRGSNENANGLLREFYPKKTDLSLVSQKQLNQALLLINRRPRKCLGWKTAHEAFQEELSHLD